MSLAPLSGCEWLVAEVGKRRVCVFSRRENAWMGRWVGVGGPEV